LGRIQLTVANEDSVEASLLQEAFQVLRDFFKGGIGKGGLGKLRVEAEVTAIPERRRFQLHLQIAAELGQVAQRAVRCNREHLDRATCQGHGPRGGMDACDLGELVKR